MTTKEESWRIPCQVLKGRSMVLSVGKTSPIMPTPARTNNQMEMTARRLCGRPKRSPAAKIMIRIPLTANVRVISQP